MSRSTTTPPPFPPNHPLQIAQSGKNKAPIEIKIVDFNLDWKQFVKPILYELLVTRLDAAQAKADSLEARSSKLNATLQSRLQDVEAANYRVFISITNGVEY